MNTTLLLQRDVYYVALKLVLRSYTGIDESKAVN